MCSQMARKSQCGVLGKAPLRSRDMMMWLMGSTSTTASCIYITSSGQRPGVVPQIVGGMAGNTAGAMHFRMSIQMSFASMVAHTTVLLLSAFVQSPFLYSRCTRFAQSGGMSVLPMAMSHRRAVNCVSRLRGSGR